MTTKRLGITHRLVSSGLIVMDSWKVKAVDKKDLVANSALVDLILAKLLDMTATKKEIPNNSMMHPSSSRHQLFITLHFTDC